MLARRAAPAPTCLAAPNPHIMRSMNQEIIIALVCVSNISY